jgi:hypothetical protein
MKEEKAVDRRQAVQSGMGPWLLEVESLKHCFVCLFTRPGAMDPGLGACSLSCPRHGVGELSGSEGVPGPWPMPVLP